MPALKQYNAASNTWLPVGGMGLPMSPVSFSVHKNGTAQSVAPTTWTKTTYSTAEFNVGSGYDFTNNWFKPPIPGYYIVTYCSRFVSLGDGKSVTGLIKKNGNDYKYATNTNGGSATSSIECVALVYLNGTTDYIEVYNYHNDSSSRNVDGNYYASFFQGCLIPDSNQRPPAIINTTNLTTDYLLQVGETAKVVYSSATSVPLHIKTEEGLYELKIAGDRTGALGGNSISLSPNNAVYSGAFTDHGLYSIFGTTTTAYTADENTNKFTLSGNRIVQGTVQITTYTKSKATTTNSLEEGESTNKYVIRRDSIWNDTTTAWISLGTLTFGTAQSGTIIIRRIA